MQVPFFLRLKKSEYEIDSTVLWFSWVFGVLNLPIAFIAVIDLSSALLIKDVPHTSEQWISFLTAITALSGVIAGFTLMSKDSLNRKLTHLFIAAFVFILTFIILPLFHL